MPCSNIRASRNVRLFKPPTKLSPAASSLTASVIWAKWTRRKDASLWLFLVQPLSASGETMFEMAVNDKALAISPAERIKGKKVVKPIWVPHLR